MLATRPYITLHYITLHYITLHYIALHCICTGTHTHTYMHLYIYGYIHVSHALVSTPLHWTSLPDATGNGYDHGVSGLCSIYVTVAISLH